MMRFILALLLCTLTTRVVNADGLDSNGCRILSKLPAPGVHPRVFFTADEYPLMRERLKAPRFKKVFDPIRKQLIGQIKNQWSEFAKADLSDPSDQDLLKYFAGGEMRNQTWAVGSLTAALTEDAALLDVMKKIVTNYARIILASKERAAKGGFTGKQGAALQRSLKPWASPSYDVSVSWTMGAAGYAVCYDVLHNHMSEEQRDTVRKAIAAATAGRKSYGNGMPRGFASSNHYGYHGDLAVLLAAIEGEPGFDQEAWDGINQVLRDYWEISYTPFGVSREDGYGPNLGLRGGGRGFMALARRGYNIFETEKFRRYLRYVAMDYDPYPGGHLNGGASGGPYGELYPTSTLISRYMYLESPVANFNYRHLIGDDYERKLRWQGWLDYFLYGSDWKGPADRKAMLEAACLPLSVFYPVRGKLTARSDWSNEAMYVTFDARPDAHLIGHDKVDRGNFSMSALGRVWAFSGDFSKWNSSQENSLVHVDGKAQPWKAPSVRFLWNEQQESIAGGGADLKYAYDWQWTPPWPKWGQKFSAPWEPETSSPIELGWPAEHAIPELTKPIHGSETGYAGTNNMHRRPYNPVEKAQRSVYLVRGKTPYTVICDDIKKDDKPHNYEWYMQLPLDLIVKSNKGNEVILREESGEREMLVRFLQEEMSSYRVEKYQASTDRNGKITMGQRLIASVRSVEPRFRTILFPYKSGQALPSAQWSKDRKTLTVRVEDHVDILTFTTTDRDGTKIALRRQP